MSGNPAESDLRDAIASMTADELLRLQLAARVLDPQHHEDLIQEAIFGTLSGKRKWKKEISLFWHLHGTMRSIASSWAKKTAKDAIPASQVSHDNGASDCLTAFATDAPGPERQAAARNVLRRILERFRLDVVVLAIVNRRLIGETRSETQVALNLDDDAFLAASQRLRRAAKQVVEKPTI